MTLVNNPVHAILIAAAVSTCMSNAALADDANKAVCTTGSKSCVDWSRLNLTTVQSQQITQLDTEWQAKYTRLQPQIIEAQRKLERLLPDPKSDPLEIMSTQQNIARMKESLRNEATTNYLRKRNCLSEPQQHQLEAMLHQMVIDRQRPTTPTTQADQQGGITNIVNKIKWAIEPH